MQVRVPELRSRRARRGRPYDGGRELAGSMGQNAERQETRNHSHRPLRDRNFSGEELLIAIQVRFGLRLFCELNKPIAIMI